MTRGRQPLRALNEAYAIAKKRGQVMEGLTEPDERYHFVLFTDGRTIFVKIQRINTKAIDPDEVLQDYRRGIAKLLRVPLTPVAGREFWARSTRGMWQFFSIGDGTATELRADGSVR